MSSKVIFIVNYKRGYSVLFGRTHKDAVTAVFFWVWTDWRSWRSSAHGLLLNHPDFTKRPRSPRFSPPAGRTTTVAATLHFPRISGNAVYCQQTVAYFKGALFYLAFCG